MRIAYLTQPYPPMISGAAIVAEKLASGMAERGHDVLVIAASDREYPYTIQQNNLTILRLNSIHNPLRVKQRFLLFSYFAIPKVLKKFQPDVIHIHEAFVAWTSIPYARRNHIPLISMVHQIPTGSVSSMPNLLGLRSSAESVIWMYERWLMRQCQTVVAPSQTTSKLLTSMTGMEVITISNGIDLQTFHPPLPHDNVSAMRNKWHLPADVPLFLYIGRLDPEKHVDRLLDACASVVQGTTVHLFIVGDGREKEALIEQSRNLGIAERVHFVGFVSPKDGLPEIYRMANVFITASKMETQGIVLLEAAASGLPIVAVNATSIPEIVHDGINGFLADPHDIGTFNHALNMLVNNSELARAMGRESRLQAERHDIHSSWTLHENLYRELISQPGIIPVDDNANYPAHQD